MHISFVVSHYENLGVEYLSSFLKKHGHQTSLCFEPALFGNFFLYNKFLKNNCSFNKYILEQIKHQNPDIVAFSVISDNYAWCIDIAKKIKAILNVPIVFGNIHATSVPDTVIENSCVDYIIRGEAEESFLELVNALETKSDIEDINNLCFLKNGSIVKNQLRPTIKNLDDIPFPDKDLFYNECPIIIKKSYMIVASRGCCNSCSYCINDFVNTIYKKQKYYRRRSVSNVIEELKWAKDKYDIEAVTFYDEVFTSDREWLFDFLKQYKKEVCLPFFCCLYPKNVTPDLVELLAESGCSVVNIGIQTISENIRNKVLNRFGSNEEIIQSIKILKRAKIFIYANIMLGLPMQNEQELIANLIFCNKHKADINSIYWLRYYPGTSIIKTAKDLNILTKQEIAKINKGEDYTPYAIKGSTFNKNFAKIGNLILISTLIPTIIMDWIVKRKLYYLMPSKNLLFPIIMLQSSIKHYLFGYKKVYHYLSFSDYVRYYIFYIKKKIKGKN